MGWDDDSPLELGGWDSDTAVDVLPESAHPILKRRLRVEDAIESNPAYALEGEIPENADDTPEYVEVEKDTLPHPGLGLLSPAGWMGGVLSGTLKGKPYKIKEPRYKNPIKLTDEERMQASLKYWEQRETKPGDGAPFSGASDAAAATGKYLGQRAPLGASTGFSLAEAKTVVDAFDKIDKGKATGDDFLWAGKFLRDQQKAAERKAAAESGDAGAIAMGALDIASHMPGFVADFMLSAGATAGARQVAQRMAAVGLKKVAGKQALKSAGKYAVGRGAIKLAQRVPGEVAAGVAASVTPTRGHDTLAHFWERRIPDFEIGDDGKITTESKEHAITSAIKGFGDTVTENVSEQLGASLMAPVGGALKPVGAPLADAGKQAYRAAIPKGVRRTLWKQYNRSLLSKLGDPRAKEIAAAMQYHGIPGEVAEERFKESIDKILTIHEGAGMTGNVLSGNFKAAAAQAAQETLAFSGMPVMQGAMRAMSPEMRASWKEALDELGPNPSRKAWREAGLPDRIRDRAAYVAKVKEWVDSIPDGPYDAPQAPVEAPEQPSTSPEPEAVAPAPVAQEGQPGGNHSTLPEELYEQIAKNEGEDAESVVRLMNSKGIPTVDTHRKGDIVTVGFLNLPDVAQRARKYGLKVVDGDEQPQGWARQFTVSGRSKSLAKFVASLPDYGRQAVIDDEQPEALPETLERAEQGTLEEDREVLDSTPHSRLDERAKAAGIPGWNPMWGINEKIAKLAEYGESTPPTDTRSFDERFLAGELTPEEQRMVGSLGPDPTGGETLETPTRNDTPTRTLGAPQGGIAEGQQYIGLMPDGTPYPNQAQPMTATGETRVRKALFPSRGEKDVIERRVQTGDRRFMWIDESSLQPAPGTKNYALTPKAAAKPGEGPPQPAMLDTPQPRAGVQGDDISFAAQSLWDSENYSTKTPDGYTVQKSGRHLSMIDGEGNQSTVSFVLAMKGESEWHIELAIPTRKTITEKEADVTAKLLTALQQQGFPFTTIKMGVKSTPQLMDMLRARGFEVRANPNNKDKAGLGEQIAPKGEFAYEIIAPMSRGGDAAQPVVEPAPGVEFVEPTKPKAKKGRKKSLKQETAKDISPSNDSLRGQWEQAKKDADGAIVVMRVGDFYEAFDDDAKAIAGGLGLTLTKRGETPMAGFPYHQLEPYLKKLIADGHRVAVAEYVLPKQSEPLAYKNPGQLQPKDSQTVEALSAHDIIATLARDFGVPIKTGRIAQPADGIYKWMEEVVRLKGRNVGNLLVATHEVAHHLDKTFSLTKTLPKALVEEMRAMDYMQGRSDRTLATKEGFAEFVRHYLTDEDAQTLAPNVSTWFDKFLHAHPDVAKNMDRARRKIDQFRSMTPEQRVAVQMQPEGTVPQPLEGTFQERVVQPILNAATARYTEWVDRLYPLKMVSDAVRKKGLRLAKGATAYALAMFSDMTAMSHAQRALNDGVHTVSENSQVIGPSLRQALEHIDSKEYDEWSRYHYARHALDSYDKRPGFNPGITLEDAQDVYNRVAGDPAKAQRYETASKAVTQFNNDLLLMLVDAGVKTPQEAEKMLAWWGETYMSLRRVKPNGIIQKLLGRGLLNVQDPVKRRSKQGSGLPVMDPIQSTILRAAEFYDAALKHQVKMALIRETVPQFGGVEGMGGLVEVVPANMKPTRAQLSDLLDQLVKGEVLDEDFAREIKAVAALRIGRISTKNLKWLAKRFGMPAESVDDIDVDALVNLTVNVPEMETVLTIWRPNYSPSAKEYIERTVIDGKPYLVQYHPDLYKALSSLSPLELGPFVKIVSEFNKVFKLGAVGLSTGFGVGNLIRDPQQFQYQTKYSEGAESTYSWARELAVFVRNDLAKLGALGGKADDVAKLFEETGGRIATRLGTDANSLKTLRKDIVAHSTAEHSRELLAHPLQTMRDLITISDVGPRLAEFVGVLRSHGYTRNAQGHLINEATGERERPPRHVLVEAANAAADVNINYKRAGHYGRWVEQFMPFFNASVQAQDKQARTFKDAFTGQGGLQRLVVSAAVFAAATAAYWWFRKDDDDYKAQADWLKYGYWTFTDSKGNPYFRVSKGFDWNIVPNLTEAFLNSLNDQQLAPLGEMMKRQGIQRMPGGQTPIGPALEVAMNYDTFRESPIETPDMERLPARERFGPHTSTLAKFVGYYTGEAVGISPAELEHLADNYTGGAYGRVSETAGHIAKADLNPTDIPGARAVLIKRDHVEDTGDFYNEKERLNEEVSAAKLRQGGAPDELADKADLFNDYATLMSELRKPIRSESDREKRFAKEKYIIGLAREALGREALDRYPSPFGRAGLPEDVQAAVDSVVKGKVKELGETYPLALTKKEKESGKTIRQKQDDWRKNVIRNARWLSSHGISADRAVRAYKEGSGEAKARIRARIAGKMPK